MERNNERLTVTVREAAKIIKRGEHFVNNRIPVEKQNKYISDINLWRLVNARTDRKLPLNLCRNRFLVSSDTPGFSVGKLQDKLGRRCLMTAELIFEDMRVPARQLVGKEGEGAKDKS